MGPAEAVRELVEPLVTEAGLECWDVELAAGVLRVMVDRPGGVDLDALATLTLAISDILDDHDTMPGGRYQLEVSSPGVERALRTPAQYQRFIGSLLSVKTVGAFDGARRFRGVLLAADDDGITIGPGTDTESGTATDTEVTSSRQFAYRDIQKAHTVLKWGPNPQPGPGPSGRDRRAGRPGVRAAAVSAPMKDTAS